MYHKTRYFISSIYKTSHVTSLYSNLSWFWPSWHKLPCLHVRLSPMCPGSFSLWPQPPIHRRRRSHGHRRLEALHPRDAPQSSSLARISPSPTSPLPLPPPPRLLLPRGPPHCISGDPLRRHPSCRALPATLLAVTLAAPLGSPDSRASLLLLHLALRSTIVRNRMRKQSNATNGWCESAIVLVVSPS